MNNLRLLTGGLVLIVLALAGGTGFLIYDRIQNEVAAPEKVTKQEVETIKTDVNTLKDSDKVQSAKIAVLEGEVIEVKQRMTNAEGRLELQDKLIKELEKKADANAEDIRAERAKREQMAAEIEKDRKRLEQVEKDLAAAAKERAEIRKQLAAQGEKIEAQEKRLSELEKKGDARDEEIARLRADIEELKRILGAKPEPGN
ncbi:MAG: hypothetical protein HS108_06150 [Planctomycetes bacterium]|jgi:chromosome segregation ATPase|nr:hypothetical protein [Planctomycetota bacterium]MCL4730598.1 hypothetical protein [Planctomycetota bacterium]